MYFNKCCTPVLPAIYDEALSYEEQLCRLYKHIESIENRLNGIDVLTVESYQNHKRLYVSGTTGDDNNDGETPETAFKTLDRFFELLNTTKNDVRCYINEPGIYTVSKSIFNGVTVHITSTVPGVAIHYANPVDSVWYNCHVNFQGSSGAPLCFTHAETQNDLIYFENTAVALSYCEFNYPLKMYGGTLSTNGCTFQTVNLYGVTGEMRTTHITNQEDNIAAFTFNRGCVINLFGSTTVDTLPNESSSEASAILAVNGSVLNTTMTLSEQTNYYYGVNNNYGDVRFTNSRFNKFSTYTLHGNANVTCADYHTNYPQFAYTTVTTNITEAGVPVTFNFGFAPYYGGVVAVKNSTLIIENISVNASAKTITCMVKSQSGPQSATLAAWASQKIN